jgi:GNAT superfamily N-acetyltransferase
MSADELEIRPAGASPSQIAAYSTLLSEVFGAGPKFTPEAIAWRYRDNPAGVVVGADAWAGETLAAHYVTCPLQAVVEGRTLKGVLSMNTATHPNHQGKGLFTTLAHNTYEQARAAGYDFVLGVANANSTPGFLRKLAFQHVGSLQAGVLLSPPRRFAGRDLQYRADWTPELLAWRLANPATRYAVGKCGSVTGVWAPTHLPGVRCAAFIEEPAPAQPRGRALGPALYIGVDPRLNLQAPGFLALPERFRASPLNVIWRPLSDAAPPKLNFERVAINFLDFDPY